MHVPIFRDVYAKSKNGNNLNLMFEYEWLDRNCDEIKNFPVLILILLMPKIHKLINIEWGGILDY